MEKQKMCDAESKIDTTTKTANLSSARRESLSIKALQDDAVPTRQQRTAMRPSHHLDIAPAQVTDSREERKANGRFIAVCVALFLVFLGIYHAWLRRTAVAAGVIVPVLIMLIYAAWVLYSAKRHKRKMMMLQNAVSLNSVNAVDKDSLSSHLDSAQKPKESLQSPSAHNNTQKTVSVKYSNINEIVPSSTRTHSKDVNIRKHEFDKHRSTVSNQHLSRVLPRQQSALTPMSLKEVTQQRRLSLDPHAARMVVKNEMDKDKHGSLRSVDNVRVKKPKHNKEKVAYVIW
ncbi:uncharacterized protein LOC134205400 [Armigeres subalbatus]|uniref:uncharacterized protein LOC134205400 n=1 Tax=Armigeres subalbatus TaxID=124917 RepID=UPI002ED434A1